MGGLKLGTEKKCLHRHVRIREVFGSYRGFTVLLFSRTMSPCHVFNDWHNQCILRFQKPSPLLKSVINPELLTDLEAENFSRDVNDSRVMRATAELLNVSVRVVLVRQDGCNSTETLDPPRGETPSCILIGHIEDHHYIPLKPSKYM